MLFPHGHLRMAPPVSCYLLFRTARSSTGGAACELLRPHGHLYEWRRLRATVDSLVTARTSTDDTACELLFIICFRTWHTHARYESFCMVTLCLYRIVVDWVSPPVLDRLIIYSRDVGERPYQFWMVLPSVSVYPYRIRMVPPS